MAKVKWVLTAHGHQGPVEKALGIKDSRVGVYDEADLRRRLDAAKKAGVKVSVKKS